MLNAALRNTVRSLILFFFLLLPLLVTAKLAIAQTPDIKAVAIVQALGRQSDRYVAGKDTAIVVIMSEPVTPSADMQVAISRDGNLVTTLSPLPSDQPSPLVAFVCRKRAECGDWAAGKYTVEAKIGDSTGQATATLEERKPIRILVVPVKANYGPGDVRAVTGAYKTLGDFTRQVYPTPPEGFDWVLGPELDVSADQYNLETEDGRFAVWKMLLNMQPNECSQDTPPPDAKCYDQIFGFIKDRPGGNLQGFTYGHHVNVGVESDGDAAATVAHEIGHNYGLGDEYDGGQFSCGINPPPADYVGKDMTNQGTDNFSCKSSTSLNPPGGSASMLNPEVDFPYEVGGRGWIGHPLLSFMGSGVDQMEYYWITPDAWKQVYDQLAPTTVVTTSVPATSTAGTVTPTAPPTAQPTTGSEFTRWVYALGVIESNGDVSLAPWYSYEDTDVFTDTIGSPYTLVAVDASGATLASQALDVNFNVFDMAEPITQTLFETVIPYPDNTAAFQVISGTQVIQEREISANAPTVEVTAPTAGDVVSGEVTIKWEASDADGDTLYFDVDYSPDGEEWISLASGITDSEWTEDFSELPGSDKPTAQILVTATDGINASFAASEAFQVAPKLPEVFIDSPEPDSIFAEDEEVFLEGSAYDPQVGDWIEDDAAFVWSSDKQGVIGEGSLLYVSGFEVGTHVITLTVTDSLGQKAEMTTTIEIVPPDQAPEPTEVPPMEEEEEVEATPTP